MSTSPDPASSAAMMTAAAAILAVLMLLYAAFASQLARWWISMPMVFVAAGFLLGPRAWGSSTSRCAEADGVKELTEITLALLLFADASTLNLRQARDDAQLPAAPADHRHPAHDRAGRTRRVLRLLPGEGLAFAALLGAILAPTDAALGLPIFNNPQVPVRIRRALNVESGLNDGIATPFVTLFIAFAVATEGRRQAVGWCGALVEIALGVLVGCRAGRRGGWLVDAARSRGWTSAESEQIAILGLGLAAYFGAWRSRQWVHRSVCRLDSPSAPSHATASRSQPSSPRRSAQCCRCWYGRSSGGLLVSAALRFTTDWRPIIYAVSSLTVVRMVPVAIALIGLRLRRTRLR